MPGRDFIQVAEELSGKESEPYWRSATSRAYYAAFHVAKDALAQVGAKAVKNDKSHAFVIQRLNNCGCTEFSKAASKLDRLRTSRNDADYDYAAKPFPKSQAQLDIKQAKKIIENVEESQLANKEQRIVEALEEYRRRINRG